MLLTQANGERLRFYETDLLAIFDSLEEDQRQLEESTRQVPTPPI